MGTNLRRDSLIYKGYSSQSDWVDIIAILGDHHLG
jgi:hypothetical protein